MVVITSFRQPESPLKLQQGNVVAVLDKRNLGMGTLYVSERTLSWQKEAEEGFTMDYFDISVHAICRDPNVCEKDCIYMLTDCHISLPGGPEPVRPDDKNDSDDSDEAESASNLSELIFVPQNPNDVQAMYESIKLCQELNPDPADVDDEDEEEDDEDNLYADAEEEQEMYVDAEANNPAGDAVMENLAERMENNSVDVRYNISNGNNDDEQFQDAD